MESLVLSQQSYVDLLDIRLLTRVDNISSDEDIARIVGHSNIVSLRQVHSNRVHVVREPSSRILDGDALATDVPGLTLSVRFADCQGFVVFDPTKHVLALMHAGWKGMRANIISSTFTLLASEWNIRPQDVFVLAGPSLCVHCADFTNPLAEAPELAPFIHDRTIDLRAAADEDFFSLGVRKNHMQRSLECTRCHPEKYYTYRGGDKNTVIRGKTNCFAATMR